MYDVNFPVFISNRLRLPFSVPIHEIPCLSIYKHRGVPSSKTPLAFCVLSLLINGKLVNLPVSLLNLQRPLPSVAIHKTPSLSSIKIRMVLLLREKLSAELF